jgi:TonB family protein
MQVVEISTTLEKNLGIEWGTGSSTTSYNGNGIPTQTVTGTLGGGIQLNYLESQPTGGSSFGDLFKVGSFTRASTSTLVATVNALLQEGKARLISKPRLVVISGKQASFLVGGEIPLLQTSVSAAGGTATQSTTYTQYGVNMMVTPTIRKGKIDVVLNVDIRDVDNSSSFSTNTNIAFITRTASTELLMDNKQTIALAGLIKYQDSVTLSEVPFLSKIPILGALFRDRNEPADSNTELVIILTPVVLTDKKIAKSQLVMPTPAERAANNEINAKYEKEALPDWPAAKTVTAPDNNLQTILPQLTAYARMVQEKISRSISYPKAPRGESWAGTVKLKLHILKDGSLDSEEVVESSGNRTLDQDALQAAKTAAPYEAFTSDMDQQDLIFTVPIVYNKIISGGRSPAEKVIASY